MKKFASVVALAVIFGLGGASAASAAPVKSDRKAVAVDARKAEKERSFLSEKER